MDFGILEEDYDDEEEEVKEGFKIRAKSRGYGVSDETYKTRDEAKKAAVMMAALTGGVWEVIEEDHACDGYLGDIDGLYAKECEGKND